jgi:phage gp36-like protein
MAYSTIVDLKNYMPSVYVQQLTDDSDTDKIDIEKANDVIRRADNLIDGYVRGRYPVPASDPITLQTPALIRDLSTRIAIYYLFLRGLTQTVPDSLKLDYDMCIKTLVGIQQGKITPFQVGQEPSLFRTNKNAADPVFTDAPIIFNQTPSMTLRTVTGQNAWQSYPI